jgi:hypothetical protein
VSSAGRGVSTTDAAGRRLLLFVAGDELNSRLARANLKRLLALVGGEPVDVEVVDVLEDFAPAVEHHVLVTPALLQLRPEPRVLVVGNLSDLNAARMALALPAPEGG